MKKKEQWKTIPDYDGYHVSSIGRIKSTKGKSERILSPSYNNGYPVVNLYKNKKMKHMKAHCAVALAFFGKRPKGFHIEHIDHVRDNPSVENLRYCPPRENYERGQRDGQYPSGDKHPRRKLTEKEAIEIIKIKGMSYGQLAKIYGVSRYTIRDIQSGRTWKKLSKYRKNQPHTGGK